MPADLLIDMKHFKLRSEARRENGTNKRAEQSKKSDDGKIANLIAFSFDKLMMYCFDFSRIMVIT
jgi:hypothetical protein